MYFFFLLESSNKSINQRFEKEIISLYHNQNDNINFVIKKENI